MLESFNRIMRTLVWFYSLMVMFAILFSFLAPFLPIADSVAHFRLHLTVGLIPAIFMVFYTHSFYKTLAVMAVTTLGLAGISTGFILTPSTNKNLGTPVKLLQFNLYFKNKKAQAVVAMIRRLNPDVITFQEVSKSNRQVIELLASQYPHQIVCPFATVGSVAVLSRYSLESNKSQGCIKGTGLAWMRVMVHGKPLTVGSIHLHWPYPFRQISQIKQLNTHLKNIPKPLVLGGDFNAAPWSQAISMISNASDTRVVEGLRFSFDIMIPLLPPVPMPIDHVLLPQKFKASKASLGPRDIGSDHLPVLVKFYMN